MEAALLSYVTFNSSSMSITSNNSNANRDDSLIEMKIPADESQLKCEIISTQTISLSPADLSSYLTTNTIEKQKSRQFKSDQEIWSCAISPDENYLAWSSSYGFIKWKKIEKFKTFDFNKNNENKAKITSSKRLSDIIEIDCQEIVYSIAFGSSESFLKNFQNKYKPKVNTRFNLSNQNILLLAVGTQSGRIRVYDVISNKFLFVLFDHKSAIRGMKFSKNGSLILASCSYDGEIKLWNMLEDGNMFKTLTGHVGKVYDIAWSPTDPYLLCSVGSNRHAYIWDTKNFEIVQTLKGHLNDVVTCEFSPDGALVATGSYDTKIMLWNVYTGQLVKQFYHLQPPPSTIFASGCNGAYVKSLAFSANGDHIISMCEDNKLRIWSLVLPVTNNKFNQPVAEGYHKDGICLAYSSSSRKVVIGTKTGYLDLYDTPSVNHRLIDLCRKIVNQYYDRKIIKALCLPAELKRFLLYEDIKDGKDAKKIEK